MWSNVDDETTEQREIQTQYRTNSISFFFLENKGPIASQQMEVELTPSCVHTLLAHFLYAGTSDQL